MNRQLNRKYLASSSNCFYALVLVFAIFVTSCRTRAGIEQKNILARQELLKECDFILYNDSATVAQDMWRCRKTSGRARFLRIDELELLMLRDYRTVKDDASPSVQAATKPEGQMAPEEIEWVIRKNSQKLASCDEHKIKRIAHSVQVKVYLNIRPSGSVNEAKVIDSATLPDSFQKCLVKEILHWSFPELRSGLKKLEVRYPIALGR